MALTKVRRGGTDTGISDSSDATAITIDSSENITTVSSDTLSFPCILKLLIFSAKENFNKKK